MHTHYTLLYLCVTKSFKTDTAVPMYLIGTNRTCSTVPNEYCAINKVE